MKVALFGGSFNPIHNGHIGIAEKVIKEKIVEEVWFIPCGNHAFNKSLIDGEKRIEMLKKAIKGNAKIKIIDLEIKNTEKSYSANTFKFLNKNFQHDFFWIIGADNIKDLPKWYDFEYLKKNANFIVVIRPGYNLDKTEVKVEKVIELNNDISSTKIRENLRLGKPIKEFVPEAVEDFIKKEGLYR